MKKISLISILLLSLLLSACGGGEIKDVQRMIDDSILHSEKDITRAMDIVTDFFDKNFEDCSLTTLRYDSEFNNKYSALEAASKNAEDAIIIHSDFDVGDTLGPLNPNSTYTDYKWILTRSGIGGWILSDWGYG